ncbi:MAG: M56 family metallopeptidase [Thermoleophilia bacterium]
MRRWLSGRSRPRATALYYFFAIVAAGISTCIMLAVLLMRFLSGSFLAAMGAACGGIFEAGHGFLAASRWNYLLAVFAAALFFPQLAFLLGGGARMMRASHHLKKNRVASSQSCPALSAICGRWWAGHTYLVEADTPEAQTVGIIRTRILLHSGLVQALSGPELEAVVAHEEAHHRGRDNLLMLIARVITLTLFYLPGPRLAYREMCLSLEKAADAWAAEHIGGSFQVAAALARIITLARKPSPGIAIVSSLSGNGPRDITGRLAALLADERPVPSRRRVALSAIMAAAAFLLVFAGSAWAVTGADQRGAFICFTEHTQEDAANGVCLQDHPDH